MLQLLDGELHLAPLSSPNRVLDVGTGTGIWAIDFADRNPNTKVTGMDLRYVPSFRMLPSTASVCVGVGGGRGSPQTTPKPPPPSPRLAQFVLKEYLRASKKKEKKRRKEKEKLTQILCFFVYAHRDKIPSLNGRLDNNYMPLVGIVHCEI